MCTLNPFIPMMKMLILLTTTMDFFVARIWYYIKIAPLKISAGNNFFFIHRTYVLSNLPFGRTFAKLDRI